MPKGPLAEPKHGWNPMSPDPIVQKLWETRHQLDINVQVIKRDYPEAHKLDNVPHIIELLTEHVYNRLNELEALISKPGPTLTLSLIDKLEGEGLDSIFEVVGEGDEFKAYCNGKSVMLDYLIARLKKRLEA